MKNENKSYEIWKELISDCVSFLFFSHFRLQSQLQLAGRECVQSIDAFEIVERTAFVPV